MKKYLIVFVLASCGKGDIGLSEQVNCHLYREVINFYNIDTTPKIMEIGIAKGYSSWIWYNADICDTHIKTSAKDTIINYAIYRKQLDSYIEHWDSICGQAGQPKPWREQRYIERDGVRINRITNYPLITFKPR